MKVLVPVSGGKNSQASFMKPLFMPLKTEYFEAFAASTKNYAFMAHAGIKKPANLGAKL